MPHCVRCGYPLNIDEASRIGWRDSLKDGASPTAYLRADEFGQTDSTPDERDTLAKEMQKLKVRKTKGAELQQRMRENPAVRSDRGVAVLEGKNNTAAHSFTILRRSESDAAAKRESATRHRVRFMDDTGSFIEERTYDPLIPDYPGGENRRHQKNNRSAETLLRRKTFDHRIMFRNIVIALLILGLLGGAVFVVWKVFLSNNTQPHDNGGALIEATMLDDLAAHRIQIPCDNGTSIYIKELHKSYPIDDGYATVEVADHIWYDSLEGITDETMEVTLTPFLKTSSDTQKPLPVISYMIEIPSSPITLETPENLRTVVATTISAITIIVRPGSRVTVNGEDCTDTVNSRTGEMTYNATVQPIGDNVFNFVVRSQYCRDSTLQVILYREPQEIPLDLAAGTYGTTNNQVMKVTATTLPGAFVEVSSHYTDMDISQLNTSGKFTFNAVFDNIGDNHIIITASYPGKKPSVVDHTVYYVPSVDDYTKKAWGLDARNYGDLIDRINVLTEKNQVYVVKGIIVSQISEKPQMVIINSSDDGKSQPVVVENKTKKKWVVGEYYRIYADADLTYNGMPHLLARFSYDKDGK